VQRERLRVFVSSSQKEFSELRQRLRDKLLGAPFLIPIVLELEGAIASPVRDASLKSAQECDIFVGILGSRYSKLVEDEYKQAVGNRCPCLIYVKKMRKRDSRINALIDNEIRPNFKYHEFENDEKLTDQIINDLNGFLLEIMAEGLRFFKRKRKNLEKQFPMQEMQKAMISPTESAVVQFIQSARDAYNRHLYIETVLNAELGVETCLRYILGRSNVPSGDLNSFGLMLHAATRLGFLTDTNRDLTTEIRRTRNRIVHMAVLPSKKEAEGFLKNAENIVRSLLDLSRTKTGLSLETLRRMTEEEISAFIPRLSFENLLKLTQQVLDEISLISEWKEIAPNENLFKFLKLVVRLREEKIRLLQLLYDCFIRATVRIGREEMLSIFAELTRMVTVKNWIADKGDTDIFVREFANSRSFEMAGINAEIVLNLLPVLSDEQIDRVIESATSNDQINNSYKAKVHLQEIISYSEGRVKREKVEKLRSRLS